ncbi:MAG TPA: glycosyltransferase [Candidatus Binataceae bacterium]|nr:glycosyltransferase [Candidatus Binataceae bacterium]
MNPSSSIAILTYRRHNHLERAIKAALRYSGRVADILVIDNAADPATRRLVESEFPAVRYVPAPYNGGCEGRNIALREAQTPILITLDDDVELQGDDSIALVDAAFEKNDRLACLNFRVIGAGGDISARDWCHPRPIDHCGREFETYFILEGASAHRREATLAAGGYPAGFFLGHEGVDLAFRLIDCGYRIMYTPDISAMHHVAVESRPGWSTYYFFTRNNLWITYRYFPPLEMLYASAASTAKMAFVAARAQHMGAWLRGLADGLRSLPRLKRVPLSRDSLSRLKMIRADRPPLSARISRHLGERLL